MSVSASAELGGKETAGELRILGEAGCEGEMREEARAFVEEESG